MARWHADDLRLIDPLAAIRANPLFYTGSDSPSANWLVERVIDDIRCLGCTAWAETDGHWWVITACADWLGPFDFPAVFQRIQHFPAGGPNAFRGEVLLTVFCDALYTVGAHGSGWIKGGGTLPDVLRLSSIKQGRVLGFR